MSHPEYEGPLESLMGILAHIYDVLPHFAGLICLLLLSSFFSGSETALCALSRSRVRRLRDTAGQAGKAVAKLLAAPAQLFMTVLVGNTLVNVALSSIIASLAITLLPNGGLYIAILVSTFLLLVFGEVTPKTFAVRSAEDFSLFTSRPLLLFQWLISPVRWLLRRISNVILILIGLRGAHTEAPMTRDEFDADLQSALEDGVMTPQEAHIVRRISEMTQIDAKEIMVPRPQIVAAGQRTTINDIIQLARRARRWRIPIYDQGVDKIWGVFHFKDLPAWRSHNIETLTVEQFIRLRDQMPTPPAFPLIRPVLLVPQSQWIDVLLAQMRSQAAHLAVLLDEYGGTAGLVSLEDILEEVVGEIIEHQPPEKTMAKLQTEGLRLLGRSRIRQINRRLGLNMPSGEADTVGGYVLSIFGDLPRAGDAISDGKLHFRVLKVSGRRIDAVLLRRMPVPDEKYPNPGTGSDSDRPQEPGI